jgi:hypothetical protein
MIGLLTAAPIALIAVSGGILLPRILTFGDTGGPSTEEHFYQFKLAQGLFVGAMVLAVLLVLFYMVFVGTSKDMDRDRRTALLGALIFGNVVALPFIWYFVIWRRVDRASPGGSSPDRS